MRKLPVLAFALALALLACGAAAEIPKSVARYIDDATLMVARVDLSKFDVDAFARFVEEVAKNQPAEQRQEMVTEARQQLEQGKQHIQPLLDAGVKQGYVIVGPGLLQGQPPLIVVPTEGEAQQAAVEQFATPMGQSVQRTDGAVLVGTPAMLKGAEMAQAVQRPIFDKGLGSDGEAMVQIAFVPSPMLKMMGAGQLRQMGQQNPEAGQLAGMLEKMEMLSVHVGVPPQPRMQMEMQFADAETAQKAADASKANMQKLEAEAADNPQAAATLKVAKSVTPKVQGNSVVVELTREQILELARSGMDEQARQAQPPQPPQGGNGME